MFESFKFLNLLLLFELGKQTLISSHEIIFVRLIKRLKDAAINRYSGNMDVLSVFKKSQKISTMARCFKDTSVIFSGGFLIFTAAYK